MDAAEWFRWAAAFFLGALSTVLIEFVRGQFERRQRKGDRRDDFQRETLLALQDTLYEMTKLTVDSGLHRKKHLEATGAWKGVAMPADYWDGIREGTLQVPKLIVRVDDDDARGHASNFLDALIPIQGASDLAEWERLWIVAHGHLTKANDRIGELLRKP